MLRQPRPPHHHRTLQQRTPHWTMESLQSSLLSASSCSMHLMLSVVVLVVGAVVVVLVVVVDVLESVGETSAAV